MTETIVIPGPFAPIILEDDPAFDVQKEYQDELDYYYETHPNDMGYVSPKSLKESAVGIMGGIRDVMVKVVEVRDELYGYNDKTKGPRVHLKPESEMKFLPDGMSDAGGIFGNPFTIGGSVAPDFGLRGPAPAKSPKEKCSCYKEKKKKKSSCCSCKDTGCLDNPRHCSREKKPKKESSSADDILSADPFGITRKKG
jgi:hypothetical protein